MKAPSERVAYGLPLSDLKRILAVLAQEPAILALLQNLPYQVHTLPGGHHLHLDDEAGAQSVADCFNPFFASA